MPIDQTAIAEQLARLADHRRRLNILEQQQARLGVYTPPHIIIEIEDTLAEIRRIEAQLDAAGVLVDASPGPGAASEQLPWRNRRAILDAVEAFWVKGVLDQSLYQVARLELGLEQAPGLVDHPWRSVVQQAFASRPVPAGTPVIGLFDSLGGQLLILGGPGSGKTTLLLELARDLIARARNDAEQAVPLVFNLSTWAGPPLGAWLANELRLRYDVSARLAQAWLAADAIVPLLDGLDEVAAERRAACAEAINAYREEHGAAPLVVCSRAEAYAQLADMLKLRGAVVIQPLERAAAEAYLRQAGRPLAAVRAALRDDPTLWELLDSPLMLSVVALAYRDTTPAKLRAAGTPAQRRGQLFGDYVDAMFKRRGSSPRYTQPLTCRRLAWLAGRMQEHHQAIFSIERMQPDWLDLAAQRQFDRMIGTLRGILVGAGVGLFAGLLGLFAAALVWPPLWAALGARTFLLGAGVGGIGFAAAFALVGWRAAGRGPTERIELVERLIWSSVAARAGAQLGLGLGLVAGVVFAFAYGPLVGLLVGLALGLTLALLVMLRAASWRELEPEVRVRPNQGIAQSTRIALAVSGAGGVASGVTIALLLGLTLGAGIGLAFGGIFGLATAIIMALFFGGETYLKHWLLRAMLRRQGLVPWDYAGLLDACVERGFLRRVGGGYIFVHRLLLEYFAALEAEQPREVDR